MVKRNLKRAFVFGGIACLVLATPAFAQQGQVLTELENQVSAAAKGWETTIMDAARSLFWILAGIEVGIAAVWLAIQAASLESWFAEIVRRIMFIGFFAFVLGVSQIFVVNGLLTISGEIRAPELWSAPMILNAITEKLKRQSKDDFKGRHFEAWLIVQAVAWYLRYPLSYRDLEEMFRERGFEVDHSTINRWVLAYAPMIEKRLRQFRRPHCGSVRIDETYVKIRGKWRYLYRAIDKHGNPVDFLLTAKRDLDAAKRFFRKMLKDEPLLSPGKIGTDGANTFPSTIKAAVDDGLLHPDPVHYVTKHLQQGIESDHFRVKKNMPKIGGFQSFNTARRTIAGFEAMLWLRKGFGFSGSWNVNDQNDLLAYLFGLQKVNKA